MAKGKTNIGDMLKKKDPASLRQGQGRTPVSTIDILDAAAHTVEVERPETERKEGEEKTNVFIAPINQSEKEIEKSDEIERTTKSIVKSDNKKRTEKTIGKSERLKSGKKSHIYSERDIQAVLAVEKRATERYSFEIYSDQKEDIQQICDLYEAATNKKLSASRLIREVLDSFIPDALKTFEKSDE